MARFDDFDADVAALRVQVQEAATELCDAASVLKSADRASDGCDTPEDAVRKVLSDAPTMIEQSARLILHFERMAGAIADDFGSIDRFRGGENIAGLFSEAGRQGMRAARVRRLGLPARLDRLLDGGGAVCSLLDDARRAMRTARSACERALERLTRGGIAASNAMEDAERKLSEINSELSNLERRLGPATGRDAAVTLAEDYARLAGERRAIVANLTGLRRLREEDEGAVAALQPLFSDLSHLIGVLDCLRSKLATDLEADVLLFAAVADKLSSERIGDAVSIASADGEIASADGETVVAELLALQARGALSMRDIERRKTAADAAFAERFSELVGQPETQPSLRNVLRWRGFFERTPKAKIRSA